MKTIISLLTLAFFLLFNTLAAHAQKVSITCFWWNGGWEHYDSDAMAYLDEIIIFAIAPDPADGGLLEYSNDPESGEITYVRGQSNPGLTTTMIETIVNDAKRYGVKLTLGINGMGRKDKYFNKMIDDGNHLNFAREVKELLLKYGMDGVDVDYEHPDDDYDIANLAKLFTALRNELHPHGLHVSGAFGVSRPGTKLFLQQHHQLLDEINIMGYHNNVKTYIEYLEMLHSYGIPKHKIRGGHGFYYQDKPNNASYDFRDLVNLTAVTGEEDIVVMPKPEDPSITLTLTNNNGNQSLLEKVNYIRDNGYGGVMVWALNHDLPVSDVRSRLKYLNTICSTSTAISSQVNRPEMRLTYSNGTIKGSMNNELISGTYTLKLYDLSGRLLDNTPVYLSNNEFNYKVWLSGKVYILTIEGGHEKYSAKINTW